METLPIAAQLGLVGVVLTVVAVLAKVFYDLFNRMTERNHEITTMQTDSLKEIATTTKAAAEIGHATIMEARLIVTELRELEHSRRTK